VFDTDVAYLLGVGAYFSLAPFVHIVSISILASIISIAISFLTQRLWVVQSIGPWWPQLRHSFFVYGWLE
jgi:hypothetical protein